MSGKKIGSEALTKLQWTTIFDVGLCAKIVVHCSFVKASLPILSPDTQTYVEDCGPLLASLRLHSLSFSPTHRPTSKIVVTVASLRLHSLSFSPTHRPTSKIVVHCSFVKASLPLFFPDTQNYVKDCGPL